MINFVFLDNEEGEIITEIDNIPNNLSITTFPNLRQVNIYRDRTREDKPVKIFFDDTVKMCKFLEQTYQQLHENIEKRGEYKDYIFSFDVKLINHICDYEYEED